jgi:hypothetical protein
LAPWKGSVTWRGGVAMSAEGEAASGRRKRADDTSWAVANLTVPKNKKIYTVDSAATNGQ